MVKVFNYSAIFESLHSVIETIERKFGLFQYDWIDRKRNWVYITTESGHKLVIKPMSDGWIYEEL